MSAARDLCDGIVGDVQARLDGADVTFAVVVWQPGQAGDPKALFLTHPPGARGEITEALATAADLYRRKAADA